MSRAPSAMVQASDGTSVWVEGSGPPVLMVHGWPDTHALWDLQVTALRTTHQCLRFTLPGFAPGAVPRAYTLDEVCATISAVLDATVGSAPVTLMLHDWGCIYGYQFAMRHPARVSRVIGMDIGDAGSRAQLAEMSLPAKLLAVSYQLWLAASWRVGGAAGTQMARLAARLLGSRNAPQDVRVGMGYPYYERWFDAARGFRDMRAVSLACPLLYLYATRKPFQFHSRAWLDVVAAQAGNRVLALDTGHWLMRSRAEVVNAAVAEWLAATGT